MCWSSDCVTQTNTHAHTNLMVVPNRQVKCHPSTKQRSNKCVRNDTEKIESNDWTNERTNGRTDGCQFIRLIFDLLFIMNLWDFTICWHFCSQHIVTSFIRKKKDNGRKRQKDKNNEFYQYLSAQCRQAKEQLTISK